MASKSRLDQASDQVREQAATPNSGQFRKGASGNPSGRRSDAAAAKMKERMDGWTSLLMGLGTSSRDKRESMMFCPDVIDWATATDLYRGDDLAARIIDTLPNEMVREGFDLCVQDADDADEEPDSSDPGAPGTMDRRSRRDAILDKDVQEQVTKKWDELGLLAAFHEALCYERAYGGAAIFIGANDGATDLAQPLDPEKVRSVDFLTALEPRELTPVEWYADAGSPKFGQPAIYMLTPATPGVAYQQKQSVGTKRIHETRLVVFSGIRVTRRQLSILGGWGDSILTRVYRVLRDFNLSWSAAGVLVCDFAQAVYKMKGLNELLDEDPKDLFKTRMLGMEMARSVARATMIDSEDEFERKQTPVNGLPDLLDRFATRLSAAADLPLPLLFGESPGGLNASGASGDQLRMFYDRVRSSQWRKVIPGITYITRLIFNTMGGEPDAWSVKPRPLWQPTEKEQAETRKLQMEIDTGYLDRAVLEPEEIRESRFGGDGYSMETHLIKDDDPAIVGEEDAGAAAEYAAEQGQQGRSTASAIKPQAGAAAGADGAAAAPGIQAQAMNGAQITSLLEVVTAVGTKAISRESGGAILRLAFQIAQEDADLVLGPKDFEPAKPPPPPAGSGAFGGPKPPGAVGEPKPPGAPKPPAEVPAPKAKPEDA